MENLNIGLPISSINPKKTVAENLLVPFELLLLLRPMKLFTSNLGLKINEKTLPDNEFLIYLATGYPSHQAWLRSRTGPQFKNLDNLIRSRHVTSSTTLDSISKNIGLDSETLISFIHGSKNGPLLPQVVQLFHVIEGIPLKLFSILNSSVITCPCCNCNILDDVDAWWSQQTLRMGPAEYRFVERLLNAIVGGSKLINLFKSSSVGESALYGNLPELSSPDRHPLGNWIDKVQQFYKCDNLKDLVQKLPLQASENDYISYATLRKWHSGSVLIPFAEANLMISEMENKYDMEVSHMVARTLSLAIDFVISSTENGNLIKRKEAQSIIHERLIQLMSNVDLSINTFLRNIDGKTLG